MRRVKRRLTVTVDESLARAGIEAITSGRARSLSGWVNLALSERVAKERRLRALGEAVASYEAEFGGISEREMIAQERFDRRFARVVRGGPALKSTRTKRATPCSSCWEAERSSPS